MAKRTPKNTSQVHQIIYSLGRENVASRLGLSYPTIQQAITNKRFPSAWYLAVKDMCREANLDCPDYLFTMKGMEDRPGFIPPSDAEFPAADPAL